MAYSPLPSKVSTDTLTLTNYDAIKGNFEASAPDGFTTKGDLFAATGADAGTRLAAGENGCVLVTDSSQATGLAWVLQAAARVYHSAAQSIATATWTTLAFDSERFDNNLIHDPVTNNSRLTCKTAGLYLITAHLTFAYNNALSRSGAIRLNGTTFIAIDSRMSAGLSSATDTHISLTTLYKLAVNDYVEVQVKQDTGANLNVNAGGNYSPEFGMALIG